jgi:hypothetical protein
MLTFKTWHFANDSTVGPGTSESEVVQLQHTPNRLSELSGVGHTT